MNIVKIGSPLFILRKSCEKDLMGVLERLAEIGYDGVELLGLFGHSPSAIKEKLDSCHLKAIGDHVSFDEFTNNTEKVIEEHRILGCGYITIGTLPVDGLPGGENYARTLEMIEKLGELMNSAGMKLLFHNHAGELENTANGKSILENILDDCRHDLLYLEPDFGWMQIGGADPAYYLKKYRNRCPVVHFKDYIPEDPEKAAQSYSYNGKENTLKSDSFMFRPTGYGIMNNAGLYALSLSCNPVPEWYIMDHDCSYSRDEYEDLALSLAYFKSFINVHIAK